MPTKLRRFGFIQPVSVAIPILLDGHAIVASGTLKAHVALSNVIENALGDKLLLDGQRLAAALMGDAIATNMFMLGAAWQRGQVPLAREANDRAIERNGVAVAMNKEAFLWGRRAAYAPATVERFCKERSRGPAISTAPRSVDHIIKQREAHLADHTGPALAAQLAALPATIRGYGHVKEARAQAAARERDRLFAEWEALRLSAARAA